LRRRGSDDEDTIKGNLEIAKKEIENSKVEGFHDKIIVNDDLDATYERLEKYIFGEDTADGTTEQENNSLDEIGDAAIEVLVTDISTETPTEMET